MRSSLNIVLEIVFHLQTSSSHRRSLNHFLAIEKGCRTWRGHLAVSQTSPIGNSKKLRGLRRTLAWPRPGKITTD